MCRENQKGDLTKAGDAPEAKPKKKRYEKPVIVERPGMNFTKEILEELASGTKRCFACANCNCN